MKRHTEIQRVRARRTLNEVKRKLEEALRLSRTRDAGLALHGPKPEH